MVRCRRSNDDPLFFLSLFFDSILYTSFFVLFFSVFRLSFYFIFLSFLDVTYYPDVFFA